MDHDRPDGAVIADAAARLRAGQLVVFPTETVYGLGAHALDPVAVAAIFDAKGRPSTDPLIVHLADTSMLPLVAREVPDIAGVLATRFWPGPLTLILPKQPRVPPGVTAGLDTVAVRIPAHPVAHALLAAAGVPVAAPSANLFSRPSPTRAAHVLADLDGRVDLVLDAGPTEVGVESTVLDLTTSPPVVRRPGGVPVESLCTLLPGIEAVSRVVGEQQAQIAPGQLLRHYAPRTPMVLVTGDVDAARARAAAEIERLTGEGTAVGLLAPAEDADVVAARFAATLRQGRLVVRAYGSRQDPERAARELFDAIRALDASGAGTLLALAPEAVGIGAAVHDRLMRACEGRVLRADDPPPSPSR